MENTNFEPSFLIKLCSFYRPNGLKKAVAEFLKFKTEKIDKLSFVDSKIIKIYEFSFFCVFFNLKTTELKESEEFNRKIIANAIKEIKKTIKIEKTTQEIPFVCNLYSILNKF